MNDYKFCIIEAITQSSTFRNAEFQNFHKSYKLPPPTTLIGFAGAALGLSPKASQEFFDNDKFKMGIYGYSEGIAEDLWKYNNFTPQKSIIKREILFLNHFLIVYGSTNKNKISKLKESFDNPKYALSLGSNDSLAFIKKVESKIQTSENNMVEYCLVEGDIIKEVMDNSNNGFEFSIYSTSDPITYDLPLKFEYESDYGMRKVVKRKTFSFVGKRMKLNIVKKGVNYKNIFIPIFDY